MIQIQIIFILYHHFFKKKTIKLIYYPRFLFTKYNSLFIRYSITGYYNVLRLLYIRVY